MVIRTIGREPLSFIPIPDRLHPSINPPYGRFVIPIQTGVSREELDELLQILVNWSSFRFVLLSWVCSFGPLHRLSGNGTSSLSGHKIQD